MITMNKKRKILLHYQNGNNISQIAREEGVARKTVRKYVKEYEENMKKLVSSDETKDGDLEALIETLSSPPTYDTSKRTRFKLTDKAKEVIDICLKENEEKIKSHNRKQIMKVVDIHEHLLENNIQVGYTTVCNYVRSQKTLGEAYIKQNYDYGQTIEFDWGEVKLRINGEQKRFQMALMTTAKGSCHFARLYPHQKMEAFLDSHINGLAYFGGVPNEIVYDNMKVAVKRFVGRFEKEATEDLMKLSMYYGFDYRFCNARRGNEKGHVERGIEFIRRKAFAKQDTFSSLEEANQHLFEKVQKLNDKKRRWLDDKSPYEVLEKEREYFIQLKPEYVIANQKECRVDKYSTISYEKNRYSVPEYLVGKFVIAKAYPEKIKISYKNEEVACHKRSYTLASFTMNIEPYLHTLKKKPCALKNSTLMQCSESRIQEIYTTYYTDKPKEFIELIEIIKEKNMENVEKAIVELLKNGKRQVTTANIRSIVYQEIEVPVSIDTKEDSEIEQQSITLLNMLSEAFLSSDNGGIAQ